MNKDRVRHKLTYGGDRHLKQSPMVKVDAQIQMSILNFKEEEKK
jgi:hypothetical protein